MLAFRHRRADERLGAGIQGDVARADDCRKGVPAAAHQHQGHEAVPHGGGHPEWLQPRERRGVHWGLLLEGGTHFSNDVPQTMACWGVLEMIVGEIMVDGVDGAS